MKTRYRLFLAIGFLAVVAACSGNLGGGGGTTLPPLPGASNPPIAQVTQPASSSPPKAASSALTYVAGSQPLPVVGGISGTVIFHAPSPAPSSSPITISVTTSLVAPEGGPQFDELQNGKKKTKAKGPYPKPLFFIALQSTKDIKLDAYPRFAVDVPADQVALLGKDPQFGLALFDPTERVHYYRLAAAELDLATAEPTSVPTSTLPTATPKPTPKPTPTPKPGASAVPSAAPSAGPIHVAFAGTAAELKLVANKMYVFAVYGSPPVSVSPAPGSSGAPTSVPASAPTAASSPSAN